MREKIEQVLALTKQILVAAEQDDWDLAQTLQVSREKLTTETESLPAPDDEKSSLQVAELISSIQALNTQIAPLLENRRKALIAESIQNNKGRKMTKAYKNT